EADIPALVIPVPHLTATKIGSAVAVHPTPGAEGRVLIVALDADALRRDLVQPLVAKHFGDGGASEYLVTVVRRDGPASVVFSNGAAIERAAADVTTGVFDLRMNEVSRVAAGRGHTPG